MTFIQWPLSKTYPRTDRGIVAAKQPAAAAAGVEVLRRGGTAVDAAIATSFASGVVEPYMSGLGGGGVALLKPAAGEPYALSFGMKAPQAATPDMFEIVADTPDLDLFGWPRTRNDENIRGPRAMALPGLVPGLHRLWEMGGRLPWPELIEPAVKLAHDGFAVDWMTALRTLEGHDLLSRFPTSAAVFLPRGRAPIPDLGTGAEILVQKDLANTLEMIAANPRAMENGIIAESLFAVSDGRLKRDELAQQIPLEKVPFTLPFHGSDLHVVPWATGGATTLEWLGIVQELDPPADPDDPRYWWAMLKAGQVALHDRLHRMADPEFEAFPVEILDSGYHRRMAESIRAGEVESPVLPPDIGSTTHIAVGDAHGNVVTLTQTLLSLWGSGVVTKGTGICVNNGMMWFDPEPGRPNSIEGGKRPLANMSPVLVTRKGHPLLAYGASGGRRIIGAVVQILMRVAILGESLADAMAAPRIDITTSQIMADARLGPSFCSDVSRLIGQKIVMRNPVLGSSPWASPVGVERLDDGRWTAGGDPFTMACALSEE